MVMKDSLIVLSGGLDSTTMLYEYQYRIGMAVSFHYGSNHNDRELEFAKLHCDRLGIPHMIVRLPFIKQFFKSSLLEGADAIPEGNYDEQNMRSTVVPFRNGIMLAAFNKDARVYAKDWPTRVSNYHVTGDYAGMTGTGVYRHHFIPWQPLPL